MKDIENTRQMQDEILNIIESIDEGFFAIDKNWTITQMNTRHAEISKKSREVQLGANFEELYFSTPESQQTEYLSYYRNAMKDRQICKFEDYYPPLDVWTAVNVYPKGDGGLAIFYRDITADKRRQSELLRAKEESERANQLKSSFLTNMSHEIRTPLASIMGYAELLKNEELPSEDKKRFLNMIVRNGSNLSRIIDDILDLSKVESGHLDLEVIEVSVDQLLHDVLSVFREQAKAKSIYLRMKVASGVPTYLKTDPTRLRQIFVNLVGNAVKFTNEGGISIYVKAEPADAGKVKVIAQVIDTGIGISEEQRHRLFKPFTQADNSTTRKYGGTGLGLTLSRKLAFALGGDLCIAQSIENKGTTFEIHFVAEAVIEETNWNHASTMRLESCVDLNHLNILLAEDAPDSQELIKYVLTMHGASVHVASNGAEALRLARANKFDVVLMDVQMPELDGYEVTRTLRAEQYNQPIIALTAHAMIEECKKSEAAGCDAHITKPLNFSQLLSTIKEITTAH